MTCNGMSKNIERIGTRISTPDAPVIPVIPPIKSPKSINSKVMYLSIIACKKTDDSQEFF